MGARFLCISILVASCGDSASPTMPPPNPWDAVQSAQSMVASQLTAVGHRVMNIPAASRATHAFTLLAFAQARNQVLSNRIPALAPLGADETQLALLLELAAEEEQQLQTAQPLLAGVDSALSGAVDLSAQAAHALVAAMQSALAELDFKPPPGVMNVATTVNLHVAAFAASDTFSSIALAMQAGATDATGSCGSGSMPSLGVRDLGNETDLTPSTPLVHATAVGVRLAVASATAASPLPCTLMLRYVRRVSGPARTLSATQTNGVMTLQGAWNNDVTKLQTDLSNDSGPADLVADLAESFEARANRFSPVMAAAVSGQVFPDDVVMADELAAEAEVYTDELANLQDRLGPAQQMLTADLMQLATDEIALAQNLR